MVVIVFLQMQQDWSVEGGGNITKGYADKMTYVIRGNGEITGDLLSLKNEVGKELIEAHYEAMEDDSRGMLGILSVKQVDKYHYKYFDDKGWGKNTYGGSFLRAFPDSVKRWFYCKLCDPVD